MNTSILRSSSSSSSGVVYEGPQKSACKIKTWDRTFPHEGAYTEMFDETSNIYSLFCSNCSCVHDISDKIIIIIIYISALILNSTEFQRFEAVHFYRSMMIQHDDDDDANGRIFQYDDVSSLLLFLPIMADHVRRHSAFLHNYFHPLNVQCLG